MIVEKSDQIGVSHPTVNRLSVTIRSEAGRRTTMGELAVSTVHRNIKYSIHCERSDFAPGEQVCSQKGIKLLKCWEQDRGALSLPCVRVNATTSRQTRNRLAEKSRSSITTLHGNQNTPSCSLSVVHLLYSRPYTPTTLQHPRSGQKRNPKRHSPPRKHLRIKIPPPIQGNQRTSKRIPNQHRKPTNREHHSHPDPHLRQIFGQAPQRRREHSLRSSHDETVEDIEDNNLSMVSDSCPAEEDQP